MIVAFKLAEVPDLRKSERIQISIGQVGFIDPANLVYEGQPAKSAIFTVKTGAINWLATGETPDADNGHRVEPGDGASIAGLGNVSRIRFYAIAACEVFVQVGF